MTTTAIVGTSESENRYDSNHLHENPLNLDATYFDCEAYLTHIIKIKPLQDLLYVEDSLVNEVRRLDSEMQQLVYENYNKFISATGMVRKMRHELETMEERMGCLSSAMQRVCALSNTVTSALTEERANVHNLTRANATLNRLQFLFHLPSELQCLFERKEYASAVKSFIVARQVLKRYEHVPSLNDISNECQAIVEEMREQLKERMRSNVVSTERVVDAVTLLCQLDEPKDKLAKELIDSAESHVSAQLDDLQIQIQLKSSTFLKTGASATTTAERPMDVLEFVDVGCSWLLGDLSAVAVVYMQLFSQSDPDENEQLEQFVDRMISRCCQLSEERFMLDQDISDTAMLVRALDRFYRRLATVDKLFQDVRYSKAGLSIVMRVAERQVDLSYKSISDFLQKRIKECRCQLATSRSRSSTDSSIASNQILSEMLAKFEQSMIHEMKTTLANLLQFTAYDVTFSNVQQLLFSQPFGLIVRQKLVVSYFNYVAEIGSAFCCGFGEKAYVNSTFILILSRFCKNLETSTAGYILDLCEQQFRISIDCRSTDENRWTPTKNVIDRLGIVGQLLLDRCVEMEGFSLSQLVVKSVETRDWMGCAEPRAVRAVVKRIVEDLTAIDCTVGQLFDEGKRKDRSSDSSRRVRVNQSQRVSRSPVVALSGQSAISCSLGKLWTDRMDYFANVDFNKVSVMTGIVKICLKTLLESVRLRTFSKYGLQQVQVDCHYLQLYLWQFVYDEHLVHCLLDEVVSSSVQRCIDAQVMEPGVVELICDRG